VLKRVGNAVELARQEQANPPRRIGFAPGVSGNPSGRRFLKDRADALYRIMAADLGPATPTDEILLRHAAMLIARAERIYSRKDIDAACRMSGEARRLIATLRRHAAPSAAPTEPWSAVTAKAQAEASKRRARELAEDDAAADTPGAASASVDGEAAADDAAISESGEAERTMVEARR
jgi:hypothetical protein